MNENNSIINRIDFDNRINTEKIAKEVIDKLSNDILFNRIDFNEFKNNVYYSYFKILEDITKTPNEIYNIMEKCELDVDECIDKLLIKSGVSIDIYKESAKKDLKMLLEKFISISYIDKTIFTEENFAYPIKLIATDSEDTRLEETTSNFEPLQRKGAFYDHKKIILAEKSCDGMHLAAHRQISKYYGKQPFIIKCDYKKGFARIRFDEYVEEGDIEDVLSRIKANL